MTKLQPGNEAPGFTLPNHDGTLISLADYAQHKVILYFYPAALTPGCTTQAVDFSTYHADFAQAGFDIIGISPDTPAKLTAFRAKKELSIELLADESRQTIKAYGAWGIKKLRSEERR